MSANTCAFAKSSLKSSCGVFRFRLGLQGLLGAWGDLYPESIRLSSGDAESFIREPGDTQPESESVRLSLAPWEQDKTYLHYFILYLFFLGTQDLQIILTILLLIESKIK